MPAPTSYRQGEQQQGGVNWGLVVGGAVATVLSLAFTRSWKKNRKNTKPVSIHHENVLPAMEADLMALRRESSSGSSSSSSSSGSDGILQREAMHRLRHQLKSRDTMIMEMQAQLSNKEKALHSHTALISNLERQLKEANDSIFEVERVIQGLHDSKGSSKASGLSQASDMGTQCSSDSDDNREDKTRMVVKNGGKNEMVLRAQEGDFQLVFERAKHLEAELLGIRAMAQEMASLLEMSERERLRLHHVVSQLQQKLAFQAKDLNTMRATTHFLQVSLGRRSGDDYMDLYKKATKLSNDEDAALSTLDSSIDTKAPAVQTQAAPRIKQRYTESASIDSSLEVSEIVDPENSTSSSAGSYWSQGGHEFPELEGDQESSRLVDYRTFDSPGVVRIGSPTVVGTRSSVESGSAQRYLFSDDQEELAEEEEEEMEQESGARHSKLRTSSLEAVVEEDEEGSSGSSSVMEEMLDKTLEDLVKATTPRTTPGRRSV